MCSATWVGLLGSPKFSCAGVQGPTARGPGDRIWRGSLPSFRMGARGRFLETAPESSCIGALFLGILGPAGLALSLPPGSPSYSSGERGGPSQLCCLLAGMN